MEQSEERLCRTYSSVSCRSLTHEFFLLSNLTKISPCIKQKSFPFSTRSVSFSWGRGIGKQGSMLVLGKSLSESDVALSLWLVFYLQNLLFWTAYSLISLHCMWWDDSGTPYVFTETMDMGVIRANTDQFSEFSVYSHSWQQLNYTD